MTVTTFGIIAVVYLFLTALGSLYEVKTVVAKAKSGDLGPTGPTGISGPDLPLGPTGPSGTPITNPWFSDETMEKALIKLKENAR